MFSYRVLILLSFLAIYVIWGTTYLAILIGLTGFPPFMMASIRFIIAGVILVGYSLIAGEGFPRKSSIIKNAFLGLVVLAGGQGSLFWSEQHITSGYASVLVATLPMWFVAFDKANWKYYFSNPYILSGLIIGFGGIVLLFHDKLNESLSEEQLHSQLMASVVVLFGSMCWVTGTLYNRSRSAPGSIYSNLGWQLLCGAVICFLISWMSGEFEVLDWSKAGFMAWAAVLYLSIAGSVIAFIAYTWLLKEKPSAIVGTYAYINPIVAVFLGWLAADETINFKQFVGMTIIIFSAVLINLNRGRVIKLSSK